nr:hypothetical protein [Tanacetum cinerariifolium]
MLKAHIKVVDILCDLELIYPPALFDIMIHMVIHLPLEALEGGPIRPWWMFPFERYMKKLKGYVQNKAKPEGSIAEGYVTEEALTFSSRYFRDVTTKFNHPDRNVDPPPPTFMLLRVKWFDTRNQGRKVKRLVLRNNMKQIDTRAESFKDDQYILEIQVKQVLYLEDKAKPYWRVVEHVNHKKFFDGGVIVVEDDPDIIHFDNSSDLSLSTSLNDLDNATLHIDGQSTEVDVPPDIIDVVGEDDDITDDEDALLHDLADSNNEDLINEMRRLEAIGTYTDDEINLLAREGKQRGCVGRVLPARATASPSTPAHESMLNSLHKKVDFMMNGSGGCGDDEEGADHQDDEDEDGDGDGDGDT